MIYVFTSITLVITTTMTLMSIPERPLPKSQANKNCGKNHLKSPSLPLPPSPPVAQGSAAGPDAADEDYNYSFSAKSQGCNSDLLAHSCSANARLCAGLTSPISPLSPLTPKYGSFISRDSSLTGINEFASSLGTSYIDSVLINCYIGGQTPQALASHSNTVPLPPADSFFLDESTGGSTSHHFEQTQGEVACRPAGESQDVEAPQPQQGDLQSHGAPRATAGAQPGTGSHQGSSAGILKRPQSLALMEEPVSAQVVGLENGRRRTVTFSQQVRYTKRLLGLLPGVVLTKCFYPLIKVANILLNGVRYESDLSENVETVESQMSMKLLCIAIYKMPPSLRSLCTNHFLGETNL